MEELHEKELKLAYQLIKDGKNVSPETWVPFLRKFFDDLRVFKQPLGHGTFSDYLESILTRGLGSLKPERAFSPNIISMCDLHKSDGLVACYAFATRNKTDMLAVDATKITGRDIVARYAQVNPFFRAWWRKFLLRAMGRFYGIKRGKPHGYPVLLVYEGNNEIKCEYRNKNIPSEVNCKTILSSETLRYVFVPAEHVSITHELFGGHLTHARVLPMELFELHEVYKINKTATSIRSRFFIYSNQNFILLYYR